MNHRLAQSRAWVAALALAATAGCASTSLERGRSQFYAGQFDAAAQDLAEAKVAPKDAVLRHLEYGMALFEAGQPEAGAREWIAARDRLDRIRAISISKSGGSLLTSDLVTDFVGMPFERMLLHAYTAMAHWATGRPDLAAVEARRLLEEAEAAREQKYPESAFARYVAGLAFEITGDPSNAALQYMRANEASPSASIQEQGWLAGRLPPKIGGEGEPIDAPGAPGEPPEMPTPPPGPSLVVLAMAGRSTHPLASPRGFPGMRRPAFVRVPGLAEPWNRTWLVDDTHRLARSTVDREMLRRTAKAATRIVLKEVASSSLEHEDELLGALARLILFGLLEQEDIRTWESLPQWLQVARVPWPEDRSHVDLEFVDGQGVPYHRTTVPVVRFPGSPGPRLAYVRDLGRRGSPAIPDPEVSGTAWPDSP